ncbi:NAD(P)-binding protein [Parathielavia appendiculata]|uniref:NAD(P)-binding protein n=1 Tax=Parathielavia appendiculata TaxID=2587402 RepID=A0AAN6U0L1_9PEZI|nr:NAD(P)-binding protein [Parathielavia appendiculata]
MGPTIVLITGGNRGLGHALVKRFLALPNHSVIAAVRDPGPGTTLMTVQYNAGKEQSAVDAVAQLQTENGIDHLDIVVANAGISKQWPLVNDVHLADIREHVEVNVLGVVSLYQATRPLLQQQQPPVPSASYGPSKAMLNWYGVRINAEDEWLISFILDPGCVQTDMGNRAAQAWGMGEEAPVELDDSADGMFKVLTAAIKGTVDGKLILYSGEIREW